MKIYTTCLPLPSAPVQVMSNVYDITITYIKTSTSALKT